ncbi:hypothetical protein ACFXGA_19140 [Actinosynnema sp. NPDC059335]|uniref:hypothetical protein n=1 Tax=Actinosynnema sp. NPDC059335 TaxID=3346804 RepID=UPI00367267D2
MEGLAPPEIRDAAEFTAALRALRVRSGLSYRQLERRAARAGDVLPASTLSTALSRATLPREQLLAAYIRACGGDDAAVAAWTALRADLAVASLAPGATPTPDTPTPDIAEPDDTEPDDTEADNAEPTPAEPTPTAPEPVAPEPVAAEAVESEPAEPPPAPSAPLPQPPAPPPTHVPTRPTRRRLALVAGVLAVVAIVALAVVLTDGTEAPAQNNAASTTPTATSTTAPPADPTTTEPSTPPPTTPPPTTAPQAPPAATTTTATAPPPAPQPPPAAGPRDGIQQIRLAHTGLCVGEGPERANPQRIVLGQHDCATATPPTELERLADGTYRIKLHNAEYGLGCATVDYGGTHDGLLLAGDNCGANRADQRFTLEPANGGYRLRSVPGAAYCIGVLSGRAEPGVQLVQTTCTGQASQLFVLGR